MPAPIAPTVLLATPYGAAANNGNWRTAARWARLLAPAYRPILLSAHEQTNGRTFDRAVALIALHARRSHATAVAWRTRFPDRALLVALTGTDLYGDIARGHPEALDSIALADRLIVLQDDGLHALPAQALDKADVIYQSARTLRPFPAKRVDRLHVMLVAHLREEKDPMTLLRAWRGLPPEFPGTLSIVGSAIDRALGAAVAELAGEDVRVRWFGPRAHAWVRQAIRRAHVVVVPSRMEGGANVIVEAVTAHTAVIASDVAGNRGMLGRDHPGLFRVGDAESLTRLLDRAHRDRSFLAALVEHGEARAPLFATATERSRLRSSLEQARAGRMVRPVEEPT